METLLPLFVAKRWNSSTQNALSGHFSVWEMGKKKHRKAFEVVKHVCDGEGYVASLTLNFAATPRRYTIHMYIISQVLAR